MSSWKLHVFAMELRRITTYRADFWVNFIGQTFFSIVIAYYLWSSIFETLQVEERVEGGGTVADVAQPL
jgi:ABC-type uncharacterized transport system permease subunit